MGAFRFDAPEMVYGMKFEALLIGLGVIIGILVKLVVELFSDRSRSGKLIDATVRIAERKKQMEDEKKRAEQAMKEYEDALKKYDPNFNDDGDGGNNAS